MSDERPAWVANRIADIVLQHNRDKAAIERVQVIADNPLTPPEVRSALLRALAGPEDCEAGG